MKMTRFGTNIKALALGLCVIFGCMGGEVLADTRTDPGTAPAGEEQVAAGGGAEQGAREESGDEIRAARALEGGTGPLKLKVSKLVEMVLKSNEQILTQEAEWAIQKEMVKGARSIFEPEFVSSYQHEDNRQQNTVEEFITRQLQAEYEERNNDYSAGIEGLVPTGAKLSLSYTLQEMNNTFTDTYSDKRYQYRTTFGGTLTQPLLKNGGIKATMANIRVAEADSEVAFQAYRRQMIQIVSNAIAAYWDLCLAQEKLKMRSDSVRVAEQILEDNRERFRIGKMAEIEVLEAEAGVATRRSLESVARQDLVSAMNDLRTLFSSSAADNTSRVEASDPLAMDKLEPEYEESLSTAFKLRPEYLSSRIKIDREDIRIAWAKNQRWPQLDLKASYGMNGLDVSSGGSWDEARLADYEQWSVGLELRIPLGGGMKSRSELEAVKQKKRQALLELKAVEVGLANVVDTAVKKVYNAADQVGYYSRVVDFNKRLLDVELVRLRAGKSNSRLVLEKEEDFRKARESKLESLANHKKAIVGFQMAQGSVLLDYDIETMEVEL